MAAAKKRPPAVQEVSCEDIAQAGFALGHKLGEGRFSEVMLGTRLSDGKEYAVKVVDQAAMDEDVEASAALRIEVEVLKRAARHPHVVALHSVIRCACAINSSQCAKTSNYADNTIFSLAKIMRHQDAGGDLPRHGAAARRRALRCDHRARLLS